MSNHLKSKGSLLLSISLWAGIALVSGVLGFAQRAPIPTTGPPLPPRPERTKPADDDDVVRITTKLVQVDAVVLDKNGKPVTDLRPEEILIMEDGRPQTVSHFSYIAAGAATSTRAVKPAKVDKNAVAAPVPPVTLRPDQVRRTIALVVDDLGLSFESMQFVKKALKKFVDEQMQPGDLVAIIRTGSGIGALQQFTGDKRRLYDAVERVKWNPMSRAGVASLPQIDLSMGAASMLPGQDAEMNAFVKDAERGREDAIMVGTLGALRYVVKGLGELPGRKSIMLISDGIKVFQQEDPVHSTRPSNIDSSVAVMQALQRLADVANRAAVVIYSMDARGLQPLGPTAADNLRLTSIASGNRTPLATQIDQSVGERKRDFFEGQNGLNYLSEQTGGFFVHNRNDLNEGIHSVMEDQKGYYLIGYRPDDATFDPKTGARKFHSLTLKVTRPGNYSVRMRKGFFGVADPNSTVARTAPEQVVKALASPFDAADVHIRLTSAFANDAQRGSLLNSMLYVRASDLTFTDQPDGWHQAAFDIVAITFGDNGSVMDQVGRTESIRIRGDSYQSVLQKGFVYLVEVPVKKPGAYQLRVALRDHGTERIGSASQFVEVPDLTKNQLTLSGVLLRGVAPSVKTAAVVNVNAAGDEFGDPTNAAAVRRFRRGTILHYGLAIYNARLDKAAGRPQLQVKVRILRDGVPVFTGLDEAVSLDNQTDLKRLATSGGIQLGSDMPPGEYVFQVVVTDLLADQKKRVSSQWVDFEIIE